MNAISFSGTSYAFFLKFIWQISIQTFFLQKYENAIIQKLYTKDSIALVRIRMHTKI